MFGRSSDSRNSITIVVQNDDIVGTVRFEDKLYRIRPLGNGQQALILVDESAFPPEDPPELNQLQGQADDDGSVIDVIVAYTPEAAAEAGNISALIQLAIDETNQSYANSDISPRLQLVHRYRTDYNDSGDHGTDLNRFRNPSDGYMDEVHGLRDDYGADIAVLMTGRSNYCGVAYLYASESTAFAVVAQNCATGYYTFGHEIGHLQGAAHNPEVATNTRFPYGHGFCYPPGNFRTIMSYDSGCSKRIQYWSNPDKTQPGSNVALGTESTHDNARLLNETALRMANFRPGRTVTLKNDTTHRLLLSTGQPPTGSEGGWVNSPPVVGADANYYERAKWSLTKSGEGYFLKNKETNRYLFSTGQPPTGSEGGWVNSPPIVGTDANYYGRAKWTISGPGTSVLDP